MRVQTDNGLGDMIFIIVALVLVFLMMRLVYLTLRRKRFAVTLGAGVALIAGYAAALIITGLLTPPVLIAPGTAKCSDEWCVTVDGVEVYRGLPGYKAQGEVVAISVRVSSEARGRPQHGSDPFIYVLDDGGRRYLPSSAAQAALNRAIGAQPPLDRDVAAGDSFVTLQAFDLPAPAQHLRVKVGEQPWITQIILFNDNSALAGGTFFDVRLSGYF